MSVNRLSSAHTDIIESLLNRSTRTASNYLSSFDESDNVEEGKNVSIDHRGDGPKRWVPTGKKWADFMYFVGPGWLVCIAYIDPGNYQANIQAAVTSRYTLLWTVWWMSILSMYAQALCVRLAYYGQVTLSEAQAQDLQGGYRNYLRYFNWAVAEFSVVITDLPEVIGIGIAFNVFFGWPYYAGVLLSAVSTFLFMAALNKGMKFMEYVIVFLIGVMSIVLFVEMGITGVDGAALMKGWWIGFVDTTADDLFPIIGIIGAIVMPHNLYLHTATLQSRPLERKEDTVLLATKNASWEPFVPVLFTFFISMAVMSVAAEEGYGKPGVDSDTFGLSNFTTVLSSRASQLLFGIALLAAGQSSAITTTYAGQYVMDGFLNIRMPMWARAVMTRSIAIVPCIAFSAAFPDGLVLNQLINWVNSLLGILLPFALTPLVKYNLSEAYMGKYAAKGWEKWLMYFLAMAVWFVNALSLSYPGGGFMGQLTVDAQGGAKAGWIILNIIVQVLYLGWNAHCLLSPVTRAMKPIEEERVWKDGEFAVVCH